MMAALMEVGRGAQPATFISDLLKEGEEVEAAEEAQRAATAAGLTSAAAAGNEGAETAAAIREVQTQREGRQGLSPAPACNLVLYDCCFEGLYFSRSGVVNLLMGFQRSSSTTSSSGFVASKAAEGTGKTEMHGVAKEARGTNNSENEYQKGPIVDVAAAQQHGETPRPAAADAHPQQDSNCQFALPPCSTEESRTFQVHEKLMQEPCMPH